jgi:DNA-binding IclR family transcriptional regulator
VPAPSGGAISNSNDDAVPAASAPAAAVVPRAQTRSLRRGLAALEYVSGAGEASVSEVATALGLPRPSAHILLTTLTAAGYLRQARRRGRYRLDLRVLTLAREVLTRLPVRERAAPLLYELAQSTGLNAYLAVLAHGQAVTVDRVVARPGPAARADVGVANPAYASAMGKALLAHLPPAEREAYLSTVDVVPVTEHTVAGVAALRAELERISAQGYALSEGEHRADVRSVAAPVFAYNGESLAAVCVRHHTPPGEPPPPALIRTVMEFAQRISYSLGYGVTLD